jgi:spoIIIJ-associated protein
VQWVETTGRSVEEAKELALDQLGVAEDEAEFEILEEPKSGLFGRMRGEARVRARVRPVQPRPKAERRRPSRRRSAKSTGGDGKPSEGANAPQPSEPDDSGAQPPVSEVRGGPARSGTATKTKDRSTRARRSRGSAERASVSGATTGEDEVTEVLSLDEHAELVRSFVEGLVDTFGFDATVDVVRRDDEHAEVQVNGEALGLLIGNQGQTLQAIQLLSHTAAQRQAGGRPEGRVTLDVGGYQQRRREALEQFARQLADEVVASGVQKGLEPMNAADRKVVHDVVNGIEGVHTVSEGEDPRRRVVIVPG